MASSTAPQPARRVVAILSFALESNVFNPQPRGLESFCVLKGERYASDARQAGFVQALRKAHPKLFADVEVRFVCLYRGFCGGLVPAQDFEEMKSAAVAGLKEALGQRQQLDGVYLDLHGAMGVEGRGAAGDAEAELAEAVRSVPVGLVAASFDHHGNFSARLGRALDLVTAYKTMPHTDMEETKTKGLRMLLERLQAADGPCETAVVMVKIPAILSGDTVLSNEGPGFDLFNSLGWLEDMVDGLLDASIFVGHQHANESRVGGAAVLTGSPAAVPSMAKHAQQLAQKYWDCRKDFAYPSCCKLLDWDSADGAAGAVETLYANFDKREPMLLGDFGDNVCAGAPGDVPFVARRLLALAEGQRERGHPEVLVVGLVDAAAVARCAEAGAGALLAELSVGGASAAAGGYGEGCEPLVLRDAKVCALANEGRWAVVKARTVTLVLQQSAWGFFGEGDLELLPVEARPERFDATVVKLGINLEDLADLIKERLGRQTSINYMLVNTPGATHEPLPPRSHLPPGLFPVSSDREWTAPLGERCNSRSAEARL